MAATVAAQRLTEAHRLAQARLGRQTVAEMLTLWPLLNLSDLDRSFPAWLRAAFTLISARRQRSAGLAANYMSTFKMLEVGRAAEPTLAPDVDQKAVATSLLVTGPAAIRSGLVRGDKLARVAEVAKAASARSAMRHVLNGGRDTITATVSSDRDVQGWARVTSGRACAFCAMLASRGPVYGESGGFDAHDGCGCSVEPVYRDDAAWPAGSQRYQAMWDQAKAKARDEGIRDDVAFRRLVENR